MTACNDNVLIYDKGSAMMQKKRGGMSCGYKFECCCCTKGFNVSSKNKFRNSEDKMTYLGKGYQNMKAIVLDMYGVIVKQTGDDFVPYVQQTFPNLSAEEIYTPWLKADIGEMTSLEVWNTIGFQGDLEKIEKEYLDTIELSDGFIDFIEKVKSKYKLAIISNDSSRWSKYLREKFDLNKYLQEVYTNYNRFC